MLQSVCGTHKHPLIRHKLLHTVWSDLTVMMQTYFVSRDRENPVEI
jgi:hypothetical protein